MSSTQYNINSITRGTNAFGTLFCNQIYSTTLSANTEATIAVPLTAAMGLPTATSKNKFIAVFSYSAQNVWVSVNATAAVPAGNTFAATTSELCPPAKEVRSGDVIHVIGFTGATPSLSIAFYAITD